MFEDFFIDLDAHWSASGAKTPLKILGSAALMLQTSYERGTKDGDVFETLELDAATKRRLLEVAGLGSEIHKRHRLYLDIVANGIPFLPHVPIWHPLDVLNRRLSNFELSALDVVDVVVSKLPRFSPNDQSDIQAVIDAGHVTHQRLVERFVAAVDDTSGDARVADFGRYLAH
jgi:hypothetical protein